MICPFCEENLIYDGPWGRLAQHQSGEIFGYTFYCSNSEGFESEDEANRYLNRIGTTLKELNLSNWEELTCISAAHSGHFYTDKDDNLYEGYPC